MRDGPKNPGVLKVRQGGGLKVSTISPGIGKYSDNIYDHRKNERRESIRGVVASDQNGDDEIGPKITSGEGRKCRGNLGNWIGALRCRAVNVLERKFGW